MGEVQVAAKDRDELGDVEAISPQNVINVPKIKELLERMVKPKASEIEPKGGQTQPNVSEGAHTGDQPQPSTSLYESLESHENYMLVISMKSGASKIIDEYRATFYCLRQSRGRSYRLGMR